MQLSILTVVTFTATLTTANPLREFSPTNYDTAAIEAIETQRLQFEQQLIAQGIKARPASIVAYPFISDTKLFRISFPVVDAPEQTADSYLGTFNGYLENLPKVMYVPIAGEEGWCFLSFESDQLAKLVVDCSKYPAVCSKIVTKKTLKSDRYGRMMTIEGGTYE